jgi:hypothetical protein
MRKRIFQALVPLAAAGLLLLGVVALGKAARGWLRDEDRFTAAFADIDCPSPPGTGRADFLAEVQYLARFPDRLPVLDDELPRRLAEGFGRHPWVERVEEVKASPPDRVRVRLLFRTPVLAVPRADGVRVVDGRGTLLPSSAPSEGLPVLRGKVAPPQGGAGTAWGDDAVEAAAAVARLLHPHQDRLMLDAYEKRDEGLVLRSREARVLWGSAPGAEAADEAPADEKLRRLLEHCARHGGLDEPEPTTHDVRRPMGKPAE